MSKENISQEFRLKNIDKTRNVFIKAIDQNKLRVITTKGLYNLKLY